MMRTISTVLCCAVVSMCASARGGEPGKTSDVEVLLRSAVEATLDGDATKRAVAIDEARRIAPDDARVHWLAGEVRYDGRWRTVDDVKVLSRTDGRMGAYRQQRAAIGGDGAPSAEEELALARWCQRNGMDSVARAHYGAVVRAAPNHAEARRALGHVFMDGRWRERDAVASAASERRAAALAERRWRPVLRRIQRGLVQRSESKRAEAGQLLRAIDDVRAVPMMEEALATTSEFTAGELVDTVDGFREREASVSLAKQAVFSPWESARELAVERLKPRAADSYLPALVRALRQPLRVDIEPVDSAGALVGETNRRRYSVVAEDFDARWVRTVTVASSGANSQRVSRVISRVFGVAAPLHEAVYEVNEDVLETNERVTWVLEEVTDRQLGSDPEAWWDYWYAYTDYEQPEKPEYVSSAPSVTIAPQKECFVAGTPVWTARGAVAIEAIKVGDLVLAQDVESGELALRPVMVTTRRAPQALVRVYVDDEPITCTAGHPFWVVGAGWTRARDLEEGDSLWNPVGTSVVCSADTATEEATYNLIVDEFSSYFVGNSRVLVHDGSYFAVSHRDVPGFEVVVTAGR